jgi:hypothetical protein
MRVRYVSMSSGRVSAHPYLSHDYLCVTRDEITSASPVQTDGQMKDYTASLFQESRTCPPL